MGPLFLSWAAGFLSPSLYAIFKDCWQSDLVWDPVNFVYDCVPNGTGQGSGQDPKGCGGTHGFARGRPHLLAAGGGFQLGP